MSLDQFTLHLLNLPPQANKISIRNRQAIDTNTVMDADHMRRCKASYLFPLIGK